MPALKRCHYDVLGLPRNATDEEIKKSFRKLALQMHPDKNLDRLAEAKDEFQILQQAYEVLSNPQERSWYDEHRHAVLRGDLDGEFDEDIVDIFPFMTSSCFKGYGDEADAFYFVYRELFEKLAANEYDTGSEEIEEIPNFGDSRSTYNDVVGPFYSFWESYCTKQNFGWVDEYDTRHAGNRRVARLMTKENKKFRSKAKQEWNQKVRALVDFVKRKDKRVLAWKSSQEKIIKEKEAELVRKQIQDKAFRLKERKSLLEQLQSVRIKTNSEHQEKLEQLESWMADEFNDVDETTQDEEDDVMEYCHPCQKYFHTKQAFKNHEKSKKHMLLLERWAEENDITDTDDEGNSDISQEVKENSPDTKEESSSSSKHGSSKLPSECGIASQTSFETEAHCTNNPTHESSSYSFSGEVDVKCPVASEEEKQNNVSEATTKNKEKKRRRANKSKANMRSTLITSNGDRDSSLVLDSSEQRCSSKTISCSHCSEKFDSRSKLFKHLEKTGHALPPESPLEEANAFCKKKGKAKRK